MELKTKIENKIGMDNNIELESKYRIKMGLEGMLLLLNWN